jgi:hypothetical protein
MTKKLAPLACFVLLCAITQTAARANADTPAEPSTVSCSNKLAYSRACEITTKGTIQKVIADRTAGGPAGMHILVEGPQGVMDASLGSNIGHDLKAELVAGQSVQLVGVTRTIRGREYLLARQMTIAGRQVVIRNEHGFPFGARSRTRVKQSAVNGGAR